MFIPVFAVSLLLFMSANGDTFPSLITTNATLAVVIDREYMAEDYEQIKDTIETYLVYAKREILKHGGVNVQYYSWTAINVKRDITAILSIAPCADTWKLFKAAEEENLLHIAISEMDCPRLPLERSITIPLITLGQEMPQLVLDLRMMQAYRWNTAVILYDHTLDRDMVSRVITSLNVESEDLKINGAAVSLIKLETNTTLTDYRQIVENTLSSVSTKVVGTNFLAIVGLEIMEVLLDVAKSLNLVNTKNQWLYVIPDTNAASSNMSLVQRYLKEGDNVAFLYNNSISGLKCQAGLKCHVEETLEAFIRTLDATIVDEFEMASQVTDEEWEAIRPTKIERRTSLHNGVKNYMQKFGKCGNCISWRLQAGDTWGREYAKNTSESLAQILQVGYWSPGNGPALTDELFPHIVHGFRGRTLPLISFHNPPWQILKQNETGHITEFGGLVFDVIKELANNLNFTFTVQLTNEDFDTPRNENNTERNKYITLEMTKLSTNVIPQKVIDLVRAKTVAMAACGFTVTEEGKAVINYTLPLSVQTYTFLVARPRELSRALLFMSPFTKNTWLCLAGAIVAMGPVLYVTHHFSPVYQFKGISKGGLGSVQNCIWYMYGALLQQGGMHLPSADSARMVVGTWWLVVLVVATTYCGNLVAFLTFPRIDLPITSIAELLEHGDKVTWSIARNSFLEDQLKVSEEPKFRALYAGMMTKERHQADMIVDIEDGHHVYIDWKTKLHYIMKKQFLITDRCDLALGNDELFDEKIALIIAQDSPYLTIFNEEIKRLHQVGLVDKWFKDYLPKKDRCFKVGRVTEINNHTVNLDDMQGSFFVLFLGFFIAAFLMVLEVLWKKYKLTKEAKIVQPYAS